MRGRSALEAEALWHMTGVSSHSPLPYSCSQVSPFSSPSIPLATSSCLVHLYPCASVASIWSPFPSWGLHLLLPQLLPAGSISGFRKTCPEGRCPSPCYWGVPARRVRGRSLCFLSIPSWRGRFLAARNSEHVCVGVFFCIHTRVPACSWAVGHQSCPLWQTADKVSRVRPSEGPRGRECGRDGGRALR